MRSVTAAVAIGVKHQGNNQDTPTRRPTRPPLRPPLQPLQAKDHNAMIRRNVPLTSKSGNANTTATVTANLNNMPTYDKQNGSRPPTLSVMAKTSNRSPLTPRVAGSGPNLATTPLSRRAARPENITTPVAQGQDISTPVSTFLSHNVTPRSGSRKSRVDSNNSTPSGTPTVPYAPHSINESFLNIPDLSNGSALGNYGGQGMDRDTIRRSAISFSPEPSEAGHSNLSSPANAGDSKFFFASDAKTTQPTRPLLQQKSPSFFYANGQAIPPPPQSSSGSALGSNVGEDRAHPKFFHANGTPDHEAQHSYFPPPRPSSVVSTSSRLNSPKLANTAAISPPQRPSSPSKLNQYASMVLPKNSPSLPAPVLPRPQQVGRGQSANTVTSRRSSLEAGHRNVSHGRSVSFEAPDMKTSRRISSGSSFEAPPSATPFHLVSHTVPISTPEEGSDEDRATSDVQSELQSPVRAGHNLEKLNELAAEARRDRKVLDLEITNSSLTAINRTLEREMRKQTAELRRYRRLSRSGRLSIATSASARTASGMSLASDIDELTGEALSDMSEEEETEDESTYDSSDSSIDDGTLSPGAIAQSDARHRAKDELRLQLDLSKHQQLLIDSQKLNQSLKRCLGWTESMISEGRKQLEYSVRVSDVALGGRVLPPAEVEDEEGNEGLSDIGASLLKRARIAAANGTAAWGGEGRDDRDSGIELDGPLREPISFSPLPS